MKSETDLRSNLNFSNGSLQSLHTNASTVNLNNTNNNNNTTNAQINNQNQTSLSMAQQRKTAIHDLTQILIEDCQKLMTECHKSLSKYHNNLIALSNGYLNETVNKEDLRNLRLINYKNIKLNLEKLLPQIDQVNFNDNELYGYIQQIIAYLEYLKFEFIRHFYILRSFYPMQNETNVTSQILVRPATNDVYLGDSLISIENNQKVDLYEIQSDINEIETVVHKLTQKYFIFAPGIKDIKGKEEIFTKYGSFNLLSKCKVICCLCSPKYI